MNVQEARVEAQAKINLLLRIVGREESGYHQIETVFCRIALSDAITVRITPREHTLVCRGERMPASGLGSPEKNLAWRAAAAYAQATGFPTGFNISIDKRIPVAAGLGGGSADAGAVLRALNALNPQPLAITTLLQIASSLGSDVPFLTQGDATLAFAWGRGERMAPLPNLSPSAVWLLVPDATVNTAEAYRWFDEAGKPSGASVISHAQLATWEGVSAAAANDFESVVGERIPRIGRLLEMLRNKELLELLGPTGTILMSGSGSTIAVVSGQPRAPHANMLPPFAGVTLIETETATFVEPVVLTH
jgi:4-diphosphocytidyl-2-C-methyl-D-erythritol kinase